MVVDAIHAAFRSVGKRHRGVAAVAIIMPKKRAAGGRSVTGGLRLRVIYHRRFAGENPIALQAQGHPLKPPARVRSASLPPPAQLVTLSRMHFLVLRSRFRPSATSAAAQDLRMGVQSAFVSIRTSCSSGRTWPRHGISMTSFVGKDADAHWAPTLAESWKQLDPLTWEFTLRTACSSATARRSPPMTSSPA